MKKVGKPIKDAEVTHTQPKHIVAQAINPLSLPEEYLTLLPEFRDCPAAEKPNLLLKKLRLCSHVFDFKIENPLENDAKEIKRVVCLLIQFIRM